MSLPNEFCQLDKCPICDGDLVIEKGDSSRRRYMCSDSAGNSKSWGSTKCHFLYSREYQNPQYTFYINRGDFIATYQAGGSAMNIRSLDYDVPGAELEDIVSAAMAYKLSVMFL
jgi:hypothetical protein